MRNLLSFVALATFVYLTGCGNSEPRRAPMPPQTPQAMRQQAIPSVQRPVAPSPPPKRPPTPEEELGIEMPGKLAASVADWIGANAFGDYFKQSRDRLARLHAQLIEDYHVRKESELAANDFTNELLRKYQEAYTADSILRKHIVECYSRKEVRPLPQSIARWFKTASDVREEIRRLIQGATNEIERLTGELASLKSEMETMETATWSQEKDANVWRDLQLRLNNLSSRADKTSADAAGLSADMARAARMREGSAEVDALNSKAEQVKSDCSTVANLLARQLEIVKGQVLLTQFSDTCKVMSEGMTDIPAAFARKKARLREIKELHQRLRSSYVRGYSDLNELAQQVAAIKERSRNAAGAETELGKRVQKTAGNYERVFGISAINLLKWKLPDPAARARIDANLAAFKRSANIPVGSDPRGPIAAIESKAYQLADRMEEEAMLKRLEETLLAVQRLAAGRR
ncbi:MAG: hypothetical protein J6Z49_02135 [Kiritimatiellae bacterium]|nr:hypothetical protein [Kiritimatiellia bacterium]